MKRQAPALSVGRHARRHFGARARQPALQRSVGNHHNDSDGGDSDSDRDSDDGAAYVVDKDMRPEQRGGHALEREEHALERELARVRATKAASIAAFAAIDAAKAGQYPDQRGQHHVRAVGGARWRPAPRPTRPA